MNAPLAGKLTTIRAVKRDGRPAAFPPVQTVTSTLGAIIATDASRPILLKNSISRVYHDSEDRRQSRRKIS
jgi:hypothetical protein